MFNKKNLNPENFRQFVFDANKILADPQDKPKKSHQGSGEAQSPSHPRQGTEDSSSNNNNNNIFAKFAGDARTRKWFYKDDQQTVFGPYDSIYMQKFVNKGTLNDETRIAFGQADDKTGLKFIRLKKVFEKINNLLLNKQSSGEEG